MRWTRGFTEAAREVGLHSMVICEERRECGYGVWTAAGKQARSQVQESRKLTQCLRDARRNSPGGHAAFGQQPRKLACLLNIGKATYRHYQIFLHATLQTPNPVCTCCVTSARHFTYVNSILPLLLHSYSHIPPLYCQPRVYGRRHPRKCAKTPSGM